MTFLSTIAKEADSIFFSLPIIGFGLVGAGGCGLENVSNHLALKTIGRTVSYISMGCATVCGTPLLVWSIAKCIFAKLLNVCTGQRFKCLRDFDEYAETRLKFILIVVPSIPLLILSSPYIVQIAKKSYEAYKTCNDAYSKVNKALSSIKESEIYITLENLYHTIHHPNVKNSSVKIEEITPEEVD